MEPVQELAVKVMELPWQNVVDSPVDIVGELGVVMVIVIGDLSLTVQVFVVHVTE